MERLIAELEDLTLDRPSEGLESVDPLDCGEVLPKVLETYPLHLMAGNYHELLGKKLKVENKIISFVTISPSDLVSKEFEIEKNEKIIFIERLRYVNDEPMYFSDIFIPLKKAKSLKKEDIERGSFYDILRKKFKIEITECKRTIDASVAGREISAYLNIKPSSPIFILEDRPYDEFKSLIAYTITRIRAEKVKFEVDIISNQNVRMTTSFRQ